MDYFKKLDENPYEDLIWNIPEQKSGTVNIVGGNSQSFRTEVKVAEFLSEKFRFETLNLVLPDALKNKLPPLDNLRFLSSTDSGSFSLKEELKNIFNSADFNLLLGDLSKNTITGNAVAGALKDSEKPLIITRDAIDLISENNPEKTLMNEGIILFCSLIQLQKLLRSVYYPKMLLMSQSLIQVVEILHKFTLSYPIRLITLHSGQILLAENGKVFAVKIEGSGYTPMTVFNGELAGKALAFNLFNPDNFLGATVAAIFYHH